MTDLKLGPHRKERLSDILYGQILEQIVSGALKEGDKLPSESQICRTTQLSRPTVREALIRLHADGLVTTRQGSGTFVHRRPPGQLTRLAKVSDIAGLLKCFEIRVALEGKAAELAALRRTPAQLEQIRERFDELQAALQSGIVPPEVDFDFHVAVAAASGNSMFVDLLESLNETIKTMMDVANRLTRVGSKERARMVLDEHQGIMEAIARADADAAGLAMRYHLHRARQRVTDEQRDR